MLGEEDPMVPSELLDPVHPESGKLWHLNYTDEYSSCFAQASCIQVQHPNGNTDLFSFSCYPVFCGVR